MDKLDILIVDDEKNICRSMELILSAEGHQTKTAENSAGALDTMRKNLPDLIFLDVMLPDEDGLSLLKKIKQNHPQIAVIMISGHATLSMAVDATRAGAYDFLEKPLQKEKILLVIRHLIENNRLRKQFRDLKEEKLEQYRIIGESGAIMTVKDQIMKVAPTNSKVLITGESGTGKELVAWAIHRHSSRCDEAFVKMNCAAIPEELTESELFGSEKGAFTGAAEMRDGKFMQANRGTLFLDEIGDMSLKVQTKVLRVLQDGQFERVGGKTVLQVNVRVIAATNKNLNRLVEEGSFREDLFYRLAVFPIRVPTLRERVSDIPLLFEYYVQKYCKENNRREAFIQSQVFSALKKYHWPGNIRELKNLAERLLIQNEGNNLSIQNLPHHILQPKLEPDSIINKMPSLKEFRARSEKEYILRCLELCDNNVSRAAKILGLERTNLHKKMKALGIHR